MEGNDTRKKAAEVKALKQKYEPIKEIPGQFRAIMAASGTPKFGELVKKARIEVQKYWVWRMNDATGPGEKFSVMGS